MSGVLGIEHVAIAVKDADAAVTHFMGLGFSLDRTEEVDGGMRSHILRSGTAFIEILTSVSPESPVSRFLGSRGEGLHHVCLRVGSLVESQARASAVGCSFASPEPIEDSDGSRVFIHPGSNFGVLMGLLEPVEASSSIDPGWFNFQSRTYSPAISKAGDLLAISGLNALDESGNIQAPLDIVGQTRIIYEKMGQLLSAAGASPNDVVKTTDYIISREGYRETAAIRREFFADHRPAATGVVVKELLGRGVLIEIDAICVI